jgi:putative SOS response-associated peptidase YedK
MCFTVNVNLVKEELENRFGASFLDPDKYTPSYYYHAFSFPKLPAICSDKQDTIRLLTWGLIPSWVKNQRDATEIQSKTFNARAETISSKPSFAGPFNTRRCLIPVKGFYEWQHVGEKKIPWYIYRADDEIMTLAGLWDEWIKEDTSEILTTFSIVTTEANEFMSKIHNSARRMPVVLERTSERKWLDLSLAKKETEKLVSPYPYNILKAHIIGDLINKKSGNRNNPEIIKPYSRPVEGELFD